MAKYQAGENTKKKILEESKAVFYHKGYEETSYDDIAKRANVNRALIPYHYKKKSDLALAVYNSFVEKYVKIRDEIAKGRHRETKLVIGILLFYRLLLDDKALRFVNFVLGEDSYQDRLVWGESVMYEKALADGVSYGSAQWNMLIHMICGMDNEIIHMMYRKEYTDIHELGREMIRLFFPALGYSVQHADKIFENVSLLLDSYTFVVSEKFEITVFTDKNQSVYV